MAKWVEIDWDKLDKPRQEQIRGVTVTVYFSPYDIPEAAQGEYDIAKECFVIRFRYLGGKEPIEYSDPKDDIQLGVGKQTQRLHEILVDVERLKAGFITLEMCKPIADADNLEDTVARKVKQAISRLAEQPTTTTSPAPTENYRAASEALEQQRDRVYSDLAVTHV